MSKSSSNLSKAAKSLSAAAALASLVSLLAEITAGAPFANAQSMKPNNERMWAVFYKTENKERKYIKLVLVGEYVDDRMAISKEKLTQLNWTATLGLIDKVREQEQQVIFLTDKLDSLMKYLNITL